MATPSSSVAPLWRWLYMQNPFYLVGTLLVLIGLQQCAAGDPRVGTSGLLSGLLAGYTLLLAAIAVLVIRGGQLWDDARTILLVIVLLFFMLSASLDLQFVDDPLAGTLLSAAGLVFALALSEGLLRVLRLHLAAAYRGPFYLMLALLFLYPAVPAWLTEFELPVARSWAMFAFPALVGLVLLTLLPAAGTRRRREPASGTPWLWPYYPWSLFVFLTLGAALRAWWLTVSFEPVRDWQSYFQPYFLLPIGLAWSALLIEIGRARRSRATIAAGMMLPLAGLATGFCGHARSPIEAAFLHQLTTGLGSPLQIAVVALLMFYGWTWWRRIRAAEGFVMGLGLVAAVVDRDTLTLDSLARPQLWPLACVAAALALLAVKQRSSWRAIAAGAMLLVGARSAGLGGLDEHTLQFWQWHAPLLGLMTLSTVFRDELAAALRELAWRTAPVLAVVAAVVYPWAYFLGAMPGATPVVLASYLGLVLLVSISLWQRKKEVGPLSAVLITAAANVVALMETLYQGLQTSVLAGGLPYLAVGLLIVVLAVAISLLKMGIWQQTQQFLHQLNSSLGGCG